MRRALARAARRLLNGLKLCVLTAGRSARLVFGASHWHPYGHSNGGQVSSAVLTGRLSSRSPLLATACGPELENAVATAKPMTIATMPAHHLNIGPTPSLRHHTAVSRKCNGNGSLLGKILRASAPTV